MLNSDAAMLACVSGTALGRPVVPDVWKKSARSDGAGPSGGGGADEAGGNDRPGVWGERVTESGEPVTGVATEGWRGGADRGVVRTGGR
eukprot:365368-Chlamydomonas_euryale.AAC.1